MKSISYSIVTVEDRWCSNPVVDNDADVVNGHSSIVSSLTEADYIVNTIQKDGVGFFLISKVFLAIFSMIFLSKLVLDRTN